MERQSCIAIWLVVPLALWCHGTLAAAEEISDRDFMSAWAGADGSMDSQYGYAGVLYALTHDIDADGVVARVGLGGGRYETDGDNAHWVNHYDIDLMLGYHANLGPAIVTLYGGGDLKRHDNSDRYSDIRGTRLGAKAQIEAYAPLSEAFYFSAFANYSTAFDTFNVNTQFAYRLNEVVAIGPQTGVLGSQGFDQVRAGLTSSIRLGHGTEIAPSAGAAWKFDEGDYGLYGGINVYTRF